MIIEEATAMALSMQSPAPRMQRRPRPGVTTGRPGLRG